MSSEVPESETTDEAQLRARVRAALPHRTLAPADVDTLFGALRGDVAQDRGVRTLSTSGRIAIAAVAAGVLVFAAAFWHVRPDLIYAPTTFPMTLFAGACALLGAFLALAVVVALRPLQLPARTIARNAALDLAALVAVLVVAVLPIGRADAASTLTVMVGARGCLITGTLLGVVFYVVLRLLDRGAASTRLAAAAAAGVLANLALALHCPSGDPRHTVSAHVGAAVVLLVVALIAGGLRKR